MDEGKLKEKMSSLRVTQREKAKEKHDILSRLADEQDAVDAVSREVW